VSPGIPRTGTGKLDLARWCQSRKGKTGRHRAAPPSVLAPGSALGSCRHGALPSAQAIVHHRVAECGGQRRGGNQIAGPYNSAGGSLRFRLKKTVSPDVVSRPARSSDSSASPKRSF
jgi:hypothetical protein